MLALLLLRLHGGHLRWPVAAPRPMPAAGLAVVAARHRRARRRSAAYAGRRCGAAHASSSNGQPRPGPFGSAAIARLDGHLVELRARSDLQQGAIVEVGGQAGAGPTARRRLRSAHLAGTPGRPRDARCTLAGRDRHAGRHARACSTASAVARALRFAAGGDDESSRIATGVALGGDSAARRAHGRGVPRIRARPSAGRLRAATSCCWSPPSSRSAGSRACHGSLAHGCAIPAVVGYAAIVGGGPSVVRAAATGVLASLAWLAGSARDPWHLLAARGGGRARARSVGGRRAGLSALVRRGRGHPRPGAAHPRLAGGDRRARAAVRPARDLAGVHARDGAGRVRCTSGARRSSRACRRTCSPCLRSRRCSGSHWPHACSGPIAPGADGRLRLRRCVRSAPTSGSSPTSAPGSTPRCRVGRCSSRCAAGALAWFVRRRPAAALAGALAGLLLALAWPLGARVAPAGARAPRHVPGRGTGRRHADRGAGLRACSSTPGHPRRASSGSCAGAACDSLDALVPVA